jgi:hypothetical protein
LTYNYKNELFSIYIFHFNNNNLRVFVAELDNAIKLIASRTNREEFNKIKSVMYGLFCGASFGFDDSGMAFRVHLDQIRNKTDKEKLNARVLRVVK